MSVLEQIRGSAPLLSVDALMLLGQAAATRGDAEAAARHYREAVLELSSIGSDRGAAAAWVELGALLDELGLERERMTPTAAPPHRPGCGGQVEERLLTPDVAKSVDA